jgi:hypothetical protein
MEVISASTGRAGKDVIVLAIDHRLTAPQRTPFSAFSPGSTRRRPRPDGSVLKSEEYIGFAAVGAELGTWPPKAKSF